MIFPDPSVIRFCASARCSQCSCIRLCGPGEAKPQSDIDLLVEFKKGTTLLDHAALIEELKELLGVKVDVVSERGLRERIKDHVLNEAVAL